MTGVLDRRSAPTRASRRALVGWPLVALLTVAHATTDLLSAGLSALLPTVQVRFGLGETALAGLVATSWVSTSLTQPLFGALSDRLGARRVAAAGVGLAAVLLSLLAVAPSTPLLFAVLLVGGLGSAAYHPPATSLARMAGGRRSELAVSLFSAGGTLGLALGPLVLLAVVGTYGAGAAPWLMVPGLALTLALALRLPADQPRPATRPPLLDRRVVAGPVGLLALAGTLSGVAYVSFTAGVPLWLVDAGVPTDAALIGVTLAVFNLSAAAGGLVAGALSVRVERSLLVSATLVLAVVALLGVFATSPGSWPYFATVALAGALVHASFPVLIVAAQDLAPQASATASALLMGFASGAAGVLYIGIGRLQELLGLVPAMTVGYALAVPAALLALLVLRRWPTGGAGRAPSLASACACSPCPCAGCLPEVATAGAAR